MTTIDELDEFLNWDETAHRHPHSDSHHSHEGCSHDKPESLIGSMPNPSPSGQATPAENINTPAVITPSQLHQAAPPVLNSDPNLDLALENVNGDDFSFWALEHFTSHSNSFGLLDSLSFNNSLTDVTAAVEPRALATPDLAAPSMECWETPSAPCDHCNRGGYQCKKIQEGKYKGYCTSCVALRCECSFGFTNDIASSPSGRGATFPANPWPTLGDHPNPIPNYHLDRDLAQLQTSSAPDLPPVAVAAGAEKTSSSTPNLPPPTQPKIGARFSRESVKTLKNWLSTHSRHPYPTDEEKEALIRQTGLNKVQITNWLANARRRNKIQAPRSTSPHVRSSLGGVAAAAGPVDIPRRGGTPSLEAMNPLQRWVESPPDHEAASVADIARAITTSSSATSSGLSSPYGFNMTDDGSGKSICNWSSASSLGTSHSSNNSFASAYSHGSRGSLGSIGSFTRGRRRRRRRNLPRGGNEKTAINAPVKTYQCTFCTLTFKTKHDWQRHEKSLHLSLERWVCAPDGPRALNPNNGQICCVFCGEPNPDDAHVDAHNHSACQERSLDERTFYRKDHLRQHLKLVHNVKFLPWSMEPWKVATPEIRSRCGFCGIVMDTWTFRVDHLAEHFKTGYSMADWKGDWGFDAPVLQMVENSIPPFLIHDERNSPLPYTPDTPSPETPRNAYELLKLELVNYVSGFTQDHNRTPTDQELQHEACRIIFAAELLSSGGISSVPSWLRDLVMSSPETTQAARMDRVRGQDENRLAKLRINGKDNIFDDCSLDQQLLSFVKARNVLGLTAMDAELQEEACRIIGRQEEMSSHPADNIANWLVRLIYSSAEWLGPFRKRASLPRSEDVGGCNQRSKDPSTIDSSIHNFSRLEAELAEYVKQQRTLGVEPTDEDLQRQARIIIYEFDDAWNQTAADNDQWLAAFRQRHVDSPSLPSAAQSSDRSDFSSPLALDPAQTPGVYTPTTSHTLAASSSSAIGQHIPKSSAFFLNDANCYRRLARELGRWVKSVMSPNNPNQHVPTDAEIQHQARWILYDDGDPWNQTAADNAEWLRRFKRDIGLLSDPGPGLPETDAWAVSGGGSGFAPPYVAPKASITPFQADGTVPVCMKEGTKPFEAHGNTANKFLETLSRRFPLFPKVFCPRELETGLLDFTRAHLVKNGGHFPSDDELRAQAKRIMRTDVTPADDPVLLERFKDLVGQEIRSHRFQRLDQSKNPMHSSAHDILMTGIHHDIGVGAGLGDGLGDIMAKFEPTSQSQQQQVLNQPQQQQHCSEAERIMVDMTESELDDLLRDMNFEMDARDADIAASAGLGLDENFASL